MTRRLPKQHKPQNRKGVVAYIVETSAESVVRQLMMIYVKGRQLKNKRHAFVITKETHKSAP